MDPFTALPILLFTLLCVALTSAGFYANSRRAREKERAKILGLARNIFGDEAKMERWLHKPLKRFGGKSPSQMMSTSDNLKKVEQLLIEIQEGYF